MEEVLQELAPVQAVLLVSQHHPNCSSGQSWDHICCQDAPVLSEQGGTYYPRRWELLAEYAVQAVRALRHLDVHLDGADELLRVVRETDSD